MAVAVAVVVVVAVGGVLLSCYCLRSYVVLPPVNFMLKCVS